jgi:hypothetical protein
MPINTLPVLADFGGTKADEYAEVDATKQLAAAAYNALTGRVIDAFSAIGLDDGSTASSLRAAIKAITEGVIGGVQIVSTATATITTARHVLVTYTGGTCTLTLPDAAAAREITVWKAHDTGTDIVLARSSGDVTGGGTISGNAGSLTLSQGYYNDTYGGRWDVVGQAALAWHVSSEWYAIADLRTALSSGLAGISGAIDAQGYGVLVVSGTTATIGTERLVFVTNTSATVTLTLPDGVAPREIVIVQAHGVAQTIICVRSATDISNSGTINGIVDSFAIITGTRRGSMYPIACRATYHWELQTRQEIADIEAAATALDTRVDAVEAGTIASVQTVSTASATISSPLVVVTYSAGRCDLTLPATSTRFSHTIVNKKTDTTGIRLIPAGGSDNICGVGAGTNYDIPTSTTAAANGANRGAFLVVCPAANVVDVC